METVLIADIYPLDEKHQKIVDNIEDYAYFEFIEDVFTEYLRKVNGQWQQKIVEYEDEEYENIVQNWTIISDTEFKEHFHALIHMSALKNYYNNIQFKFFYELGWI